MLSQSSQPSRDVDEATVLQVDHQHCLCKVRTLRGQILHQVRWLTPFGGSTRGSDRFSPHMGDRVMIEHGLGAPVIVGFFPRLQIEDGSTPLSLANGEVAIDTGNYSSSGVLAIPDQNKPRDSVGGDRLLSSIGGALLGLLRGGTVLIRSSRTSEIILSKYLSLVRVVSRNWEHFTDVCSDVVKNFKGKVYRYTGYSNNFIEAKNEQYRLNFYYGDVATAEAVKTNYLTSTAEPEPSGVIFKEQILSELSEELMRRTLDVTGSTEVWIKTGENFTKVSSTGNSIVLSFKDLNTVTIQEDKIQLIRSDGAEVLLNADGIKASFQSGSVTLNSSSVEAKFESSTATLNSSQASVQSNGHFSIVSASGVALG